MQLTKEMGTTGEMAKVLGKSINGVKSLIASGEIRASKIGNRFLIPREEFERIQKQIKGDIR